MSEEHDERTQVEAAQRDPSRFADLYEQNFYRVYAYIVRRVGDRHQAEDLTADVFREALAESSSGGFLSAGQAQNFADWIGIDDIFSQARTTDPDV